MKISILTNIVCVLLSGLLLPSSQVQENKSPVSMEINVSDLNSGNEYSGTVSSVTIHHAEQDVLIFMEKNKTLSFKSSGSNKSLNSFLTEEEYFSFMTVKVGEKKVRLNGVSRTALKRSGGVLTVSVRFKSVR